MAAENRRSPTLDVLRHRAFRLVALGNFVSQLGTWSQMVGIGWAARSITASPQAVTIAFAAQFAPNLILGPFGGMLADRFDRRRVTIIGNLAMALPSALIGVFLTTGGLTMPLLVGLALGGGAAGALTMPASQALVPSLVPIEEVPHAIAITSALQNVSRLLGAALAGLLISTLGTATAFYWNALSFMAVVGAWLFVRTASTAPGPATTEGVMQRLMDGFRYARRVPTVRYLVLVNVGTALLTLHSPLLPIVVKDVLHADVSTYAALQMATAVGAIGGAFIAGRWLTDDRRRQAIAVGMFVTAAAVTSIGFSRWIWASILLQCIYGFGFFVTNTVGQTMVMMATEDAYLGRVMAVYSTALAGMLPINAVIAGYLAARLGTIATIVGAGLTMLMLTAWFTAFRLPRLGVPAATTITLAPSVTGPA